MVTIRAYIPSTVVRPNVVNIQKMMLQWAMRKQGKEFKPPFGFTLIKQSGPAGKWIATMRFINLDKTEAHHA